MTVWCLQLLCVVRFMHESKVSPGDGLVYPTTFESVIRAVCGCVWQLQQHVLGIICVAVAHLILPFRVWHACQVSGGSERQWVTTEWREGRARCLHDRSNFACGICAMWHEVWEQLLKQALRHYPMPVAAAIGCCWMCLQYHVLWISDQACFSTVQQCALVGGSI